MVTGKWLEQGDAGEAVSLREAVFGRGRDATDNIARCVVVYDDSGAPVGAARLFWQGGAFRVDLVGVLQEHRGRGYGDLLMRLAIYKAVSHGAKTLLITPTDETRGFFTRYGFIGESEMALPLDEKGIGCKGY